MQYALLPPIGNAKMARYLIEHGANTNVKNNAGHTPLLTAAAMNPPNQIDLVNLLIENGADTKVADNNNETVLFIAVENGNSND